jgi:murein DD-endopeptidase MepM/ murein hydrolase activator NlpD
MPRSHRPFPTVFRVLAAVLALAAVALVVTPGAGAAPSQQDVDDARARVEQLLDTLDAKRAELASIQEEVDRAAFLVDQTEGRLESITADLLETRARLEAARIRYRRIVDRLNERAVERYMGGGVGGGLDFLLGATSLTDLSDRLEFSTAVALSDADLAVEAESLRRALSRQERRLEELQAQQREELAAAQEQEAAVEAKLEQMRTITQEIAAATAEAEAELQKVKKEREKYLQRLAASSAYGGSHSSVPLPAGYEDVLQVCPVGEPRAFGDGFGAPRYAGGYHLHKGVDILAPSGTPILAPFDGVAKSDSNSLGGLVVFVYGTYGRVYNAHLSAYSPNSNGSVQAGDVIGYVGDTGDATGIPHDHFEFHPNVLPSSWPTSYYGYSIIEDAVNPYPLLVAACG